MNAYEEAAAVVLRETGCTIRRWRTRYTGVAHTRDDDWGVEAPRPRGAVSFGVLLHEVGHQMLHRTGSKPRWREEVEAEDYALAAFERFGLDGADRFREHAARHLAWSFAKAVRRSGRLAAEIADAYPEWWELARRHDRGALALVLGAAYPANP